MIDTHSHLDVEDFDADRDLVVERAKAAGVEKILVPAIDLKSLDGVVNTARRYPGYAFPMIGLQPEEVKADWQQVLDEMHRRLSQPDNPFIAVGEVGLDFYWSREFENEQLAAFERQVEWAEEFDLPLMIHCRKAQNEMVQILRRHEGGLKRGGVFHCFTGNALEAEQLLRFDRFVLGVGGVLTFKKSHLPEVLPTIPADRVVIETDAPYMAPVPMRGKRNESAFVIYVLERMAERYGKTVEEMERITVANTERVFGKL